MIGALFLLFGCDVADTGDTGACTLAHCPGTDAGPYMPAGRSVSSAEECLRPTECAILCRSATSCDAEPGTLWCEDCSAFFSHFNNRCNTCELEFQDGATSLVCP